MSGEPHNRYMVQKRYRKPPPAPYENPWRDQWSFTDVNDALEAMRETLEPMTKPGTSFCVYRMLDTDTGNSVELEPGA